MYAVLKTGGKQYTVHENETIKVEKLDVPVGEEVVFDDILFVNTDKAQIIGTPTVSGAKVIGRVLRHGLGKKIIGFTYKPKKRERRRFGHRQPFTEVSIEKIEYKTRTTRKAEAPKAPKAEEAGEAAE